MYLPALPKLAAEFASPQSLVQLTLTSCVVGLAVGQLFAGPLSDSLGRRRPLLVGLAMFALLSLACAFASSVQMLIWLRLAQALSASAGLVIARAVVRDLFSGHAMARFFSVLMLVNGLAPILAPVFGGQLLRFTSWRGVFVVLAGIGVLLFAVCAWLLPETLPAAGRSSGRIGATLSTYVSLLRDRGFTGYVLVAALSFAGLFTYVSSSSFVLQQVYGLTPQQFSLVFGANSLGIVAFGQLNGRLVGRFEPITLMKTGLLIAAASGVALLAVVLLDSGLVAVLIPLLFSVSSIGMIMPNSATLALTNYPNAAGAASAMLGFGQFLIGGLIAPLVGLGGADALPMAATIAGMACASLLLCFTYARPPAATVSGTS